MENSEARDKVDSGKIEGKNKKEDRNEHTPVALSSEWREEEGTRVVVSGHRRSIKSATEKVHRNPPSSAA